MATRGNTTFQKRQKELARKQKQQDKAARREERRLARDVANRVPPQDAPDSSDEVVSGQPLSRNETMGD
jgi:hypothetical protein